MKAGDRFPSVRALSKAFKINPNTAHKVIAHLLAERLLEVRPGIGTVVGELPEADAAARQRLIERATEHLVVEARRVGLSLEELQSAIETQWERLRPESQDDPNT